jgi:hypothetical protein
MVKICDDNQKKWFNNIPIVYFIRKAACIKILECSNLSHEDKPAMIEYDY